MRKLLAAVSLICGVIVAAQENPTFEVASVKQNTSADGRQLISTAPGGRVTLTNIPARQLVVVAYQLTPLQLVGGPSWLADAHYDIVAKLAGEPQPIAPGKPSPAMLALRSLLAERFKLKLHNESRELDVYNLVMVKPGVPGPALEPSTTDCVAMANARRGGPPQLPQGPPGPNDPFPCGIFGGPGMIRMGGQRIAPAVTQMLTNQSGRLVFDQTNLAGNWDFTLRFAFEQRGGQPPLPGVNLPPPDPDAPSLFTAIQEQLGLKLESAKRSVDVMVIDSVEHPTED